LNPYILIPIVAISKIKKIPIIRISAED
jgi:hypothetical protein